MSAKSQRIGILVLLLAVFFFAAQLHFCADLAGSLSSHVCPVCSTVGAAALVSSANIVVSAPSPIDRLEIYSSVGIHSADLPGSTAPRAPPAA